LLRGTMLAVNIHPGIESGIWRNLFAATGLAGIVLCGTGTSSKLSTWTFRLPGPIS
jgi:L-asparaginase/Glu-tRNA(Gln) amidotransferase subunit D